MNKEKEALSSITRYQKDKTLPLWLEEIREKAYARYQTLGLPTRKMDVWKYANLEKLLRTSFGQISDEQVLKYDAKNLPAGVILSDLRKALEKHSDKMKRYLGRTLNTESNSFALLNTFNFREGVFLFVPANAALAVPIEINFSGEGQEEAPVFCPRILVILEDGAKANVTFRQTSLNGKAYFSNAVAEIYLGKGANLHWDQVDKESESAFQFFTVRAALETQSQLEMISFTSGGDITRQDTEVLLQGENASAWVGGLSLLSGHSEVANVVTVKHDHSDGISRQLFKNILSGQAQAEFTSLVHVGKGTQRSDSNQLNRNLILSDSAHAYSRPQLKIDADDVRASHGSATGQPDPNELFYLKSRGLAPETARLVLSFGFAEEVLEKIKDRNLREELERGVRKSLEGIFKK
ncbi:MAG: Fe-S cluster assembly protein SufD [Candidatus Omnitrophica bacterium]|nr:Fe-S cluster assembly protein SufD [Candidatus Omnitrophota bacterium]